MNLQSNFDDFSLVDNKSQGRNVLDKSAKKAPHFNP